MPEDYQDTAPPQTDPIERLYKTLSTKGYYTKSFDDFKQKYSSPQEIDKIYGVVSRDGLYTKSKDEFYNQYFPQPTQEPVKKKVGGDAFSPYGFTEAKIGLPEVSTKPQSEAQELHPGELTIGYKASDARVGGEKPKENRIASLSALGKAAALGAGSGIAGIPKAIAVASKDLDLFNEYEGKDAKDLATYKAGQWVEDMVKDLVGDLTPEEQQNTSVQLAQTLGNTATIFAGGAGSKLLKLSPVLTTAAMGAAQQGIAEYENAINSGATPDQASKVFWINAAIGTTDAWPMAGVFRKLDKYTGGAATGALARKLATTVEGRLTNEIFQGALKEAAQEAGQQMLTNLTAQQTYDATRSIFQDVPKSGLFGGLIGGTLTGVTSGIREIRTNGNISPEEDAQLAKAEEFAQEKIKEINDTQKQKESLPPTPQEEAQPQKVEEIVPKEEKVTPSEKVTPTDDITKATEAAKTDIKDEVYRNAFTENPEQSLKELAQQLNSSEVEASATRRMFGDTISDIALKLYPKEKVAPQDVSGKSGEELAYNDKGQHLAPNGNPSKLSEEQAKTTRTKAFKNWFGDWEKDPENASKVVDENGEPLVVYHGTVNDFNEFKHSKDIGFHFGDLDQAKYRSANRRIIPAYLKAKNLVEIDDVFAEANSLALFREMEDKKILTPEEIQDIYDNNIGARINEGLKKKLLEKGIDGFKYKNLVEGKGYSYVVFKPSDIKLADGSNKRFNPESNDIRDEAPLQAPLPNEAKEPNNLTSNEKAPLQQAPKEQLPEATEQKETWMMNDEEFDTYWLSEGKKGVEKEVAKKVGEIDSKIKKLQDGIKEDPSNPANSSIRKTISDLEGQKKEEEKRLTAKGKKPSEFMDEGQKRWHKGIDKALEEGKYPKAISEGKITANDAKEIIESAGLEVPKEILDQVKNQGEKPERSVATEDAQGAEAGKPPTEPPKEEAAVAGGEEDLPERRFTKQMLRSDELSEATKDEVMKTLNYTRQTNEMSLKEANDVIDRVGLDEAQNHVMNDTELKPVVRVVLGQTLIKKYNELSEKADNEPEKYYYLDKSIQTANFVTEKLATEAGQQIQAFSMWSRLSPEGQLRAANQDMARQGKEKLERRKKDINVISDKFKKANEEAADELTKSEGVKKAVEKTESTRVKKAKDKIAEAKKKRDDIIKKYKGGKGKNLYSSPTGLTSEGIEFVGDLVKTYIQEGVAKLEIVVDKVLQHLKEVSGKVPNDEVRKNVTDIVREQVDKKENQQIKESLSDLEKEINKIVREHYTIPEEAKKSLIDKFVEKTGLEKDEATQLAKDIETEFDKIATRKKRNILYNEKARFDKINKTLQSGKKTEPKTVQDELIKYSNLGAFENRDFNEMVAHKFGLGELTTEQAAKLLELAKKVQKAPEGSPKNAATEDLLAYRANLRGNNLAETAQAVWYSNILSGYKTHEKNLVSTFFNSMGELGAEIAKDPKALPYILGGYIKGVSKRGLVEAKHTLATGRSPIHIKKIETPTTLERKNFSFLGLKGGWNPANWFKYVTRLMVAEDVLSFQGLKEARAYQLARKEAAKQGYNTWSRKGWNKVNEILYHTKERLDEATRQAEGEGLKGTEAKRRIYELMEDSRPQKMTEDAYGFAAHGTFNHESEGTLGAITNAVAHALDAVNIGGLKPGRIIVPFTRIITNVVNNSLDFSPVGFIRAARGERGFKTFNENQYTKGAYKELSRDERQRLVAKAAIGITMTAALQALHQAGAIQITGAGPDDPKKKQQLMQEGWQPYSIKVGNKYYSYQYTPLVFVTGFLGNMNDAEKYGEKESEKTFGKRMELAASRIGGQVADMTWINSASTFLGALTESNPNAQEKKLSNIFSSTARGAIPFSGTITQAGQLGQNIFNMPQKQVNSGWEALIQDIPIARNSLNDKVNALGEPIIRDIDVVQSKETTDPVWKFLLDKQGWVAPVNRGTLIIYDPETKTDRPVTNDEYYEFSKVRGQKIRKEIEKIIDKGATIDENKKKQRKSADELTTGQLNILLSNIERDATKDTKEELFAPKEKKRLKISVNK